MRRLNGKDLPIQVLIMVPVVMRPDHWRVDGFRHSRKLGVVSQVVTKVVLAAKGCVQQEIDRVEAD